MMPRKSRGGKSGAQFGNQNALNNGLYTAHFSPGQSAKLARLSPLETHQEISALRIIIDRILGDLDQCQDEDRRVRLYNSFSLAAHRLASLMRIQKLLVDDEGAVFTTIYDLIRAVNGRQGVR